MPQGISSAPIRAAIDAALVTEGEIMRTVVPLYKVHGRARIRVADAFVGHRVVVEVWPNRTEGDPQNKTIQFCRVLSAAINPDWGDRGMEVLVLEFEGGLNKRDLPVPFSQVHSIRTITEEEGSV